MGDLTQQDVDGIIEEKNRLVRENYRLLAAVETARAEERNACAFLVHREAYSNDGLAALYVGLAQKIRHRED